MAITSVKTGSSFTNLQKYDSMLAGNAANGDSATWLIQRITASGTSASITFSGIPQTYTHLQLRVAAVAPGEINHLIQFNGDTASNYSWHELYGTGAAAAAGALASASSIKGGYNGGTLPASTVIDILDYANTNKYKTTRGLAGSDNNTGSNNYILFRSGSWRSTSAINSINISTTGIGGAFSQYSTFALYGIKG
jgi:hypothetical protein